MKPQNFSLVENFAQLRTTHCPRTRSSSVAEKPHDAYYIIYKCHHAQKPQKVVQLSLYKCTLSTSFFLFFLFLRGVRVSLTHQRRGLLNAGPMRSPRDVCIVLCGSHRCHRWGVYVCVALPSTLSGPGSSSRLIKRS